MLIQADAAAGISVGWFRASGSLGYPDKDGSPRPSPAARATGSLAPAHSAPPLARTTSSSSAGRMNLPFGLRIIEHTSFVRAATGRTSTPPSSTACRSRGTSKAGGPRPWPSSELPGPAGRRPRARRRVLVERIDTNAAVGLSGLLTHQGYDPSVAAAAFRHAYGGFARYSPVKPLVVMAEADLLVRSPKAAPIDVGTTALLQLDFEPTQGVHVAGTGELLTNAIGNEGLSAGAWASAFWFFLPHLDVRTDLVTARGRPGRSGRIAPSSRSSTGSSDDVLALRPARAGDRRLRPRDRGGDRPQPDLPGVVQTH